MGEVSYLQLGNHQHRVNPSGQRAEQPADLAWLRGGKGYPCWETKVDTLVMISGVNCSGPDLIIFDNIV